MNKLYLSLLCLTFAYPIKADDDQDSIPEESIPLFEESIPLFEESIPLFKERDLFEQLKVQEELEKMEPKLSQEQINLLKSIFTAKRIKEATGRQVPNFGHDNQRIITYTNTPTKPSHIVVTFSAQETLENSIASLQSNHLAHNFIIDVDGKIYPVTKKGESIEDALSHRPFAVGISGKVIDGKYEERDMNSASITISLVGKDDKLTTQKQEEALTQVISWLLQKFEIKPYNVVDYGIVALPYGRRNTQKNLPWKKLAEKGLSVWPQVPDWDPKEILPIIPPYPGVTARICCAFRKIGFLCPIVDNYNNEDFKKIVKTFQKHYQCYEQSGLVTLETYDKLTNIIDQMEQLDPKFENIYPTAEDMSPKELRNRFSKTN